MKKKFTPNTVVFDFESASLERNAGLISIGAFAFDRFDLKSVDAMAEDYQFKFSANLDLTEQFFLGFDINWETGRWWRERNSHEIQNVLKDRISIHEAIKLFHEFLDKFKDALFFCRHTHADYTWYENACKLLNIKPRIRYSRVYDIATAVLTHFDEPKGYIDGFERKGAHNALGDSIHDARQLAACFDKSFQRSACVK